MAVKDGQAWGRAGFDEVDIMDILVSVKFDDCTVADLDVIRNAVTGVESNCNDQCSPFRSLGNLGLRLHILRHQDKARFWACANAAGCDSCAGIQIEAIRCACKLNMKRDDII